MAAGFKLNGAEVIYTITAVLAVASTAKKTRRTEDRGAAILAERYECLVKILFGLESRSKLKGFTQIDSLAHPDAMPKLRFYLSGNHIRIIAFAL
jgi:hypothetical protein